MYYRKIPETILSNGLNFYDLQFALDISFILIIKIQLKIMCLLFKKNVLNELE